MGGAPKRSALCETQCLVRNAVPCAKRSALGSGLDGQDRLFSFENQRKKRIAILCDKTNIILIGQRNE